MKQFKSSLDLGEQLFEGAGHKVYQHPEDATLLVKIPKGRHFSYERVQEDIEFCRARFAEWFIQTEAYTDSAFGYRLIQTKVQEAEPLRPSHLESESLQVEFFRLLDANQRSIENEGIGIDFIGLRGSTKCALASLDKHRFTFIDSYLITPLLWIAGKLNLRLVPRDVLEIWRDINLEPEIGNIILGTVDGVSEQLALVDLSLVRVRDRSFQERIRAFVLQRWNNYFLGKYFTLNKKS